MSEFKEYIKKEPRKATFKNQPVASGFKASDDDPMVWEPIPDEIDSLNRILNKIAEGTLSQHASPQVFKRDTGKDISWTTIRKLAISLGVVTVKENSRKKVAAKRRIDLERYRTQARVAQAQNKLKKLKEKARELGIIKDVVDPAKPKLVTEEQIAAAPAKVQSIIENTTDVIFKANPGPQSDFLAASEREVFYGGARGGGKSYSLIVDPLRHCDKAAHRALILRRTMPELRDLINHSQRLYKKAFPGATWREQEKEWRFPSGARIEFGYAESSQDALRYQGQSYTYIGVDELPQFPTPDIWNDLRGALRSVDPDIPEYMRATGNPGNVGSAWVKEMFVDPAPPNTTFFYEVDLPDGTKNYISRRFIPAKLSDNPYLTRTKAYMTMLASLPEIKRKQWLDGSWEEQEGLAFPDFKRDIHVVDPKKVDILPSMPKFRAADFGFSSPACVLWFAVDHENNLWVYREYYGKGVVADQFADRILQMEQGESIKYGVLDSSVWARRGDTGPGIPEIMAKRGLVWRMSDRSPGSRINGKYEIHRRFSCDPITGKPKIFIFNTCRNLIKQLSSIPIDPNDPEDCDTKQEDHAIDALRYGVMSRPLNPNSYDANIQIKRQPEAPVDKFFGY